MVLRLLRSLYHLELHVPVMMGGTRGGACSCTRACLPLARFWRTTARREPVRRYRRHVVMEGSCTERGQSYHIATESLPLPYFWLTWLT